MKAMKIVVCIKQVPDTSEVRIDPKTNRLMREGVPSIINPDDRSAIEVALRFKETTEAHVTALSMGPPQAEMALREALALGCDDAVLISGREFGGSDTYATASILAAAINKIGFDLVLAGRQAIDGDTAQVGPQVAEQLFIPQVTYAGDLQFSDDGLVVTRYLDAVEEIVKVKSPCLVTTLAEVAKPRYMTAQGIVDAFENDITLFEFEDLKDLLNPDWIGLKGSPTSVVKSFPKEAKGLGVKLSDLSTNEAVEVIIEKLSELGIV
jgi:electron transfer flavoprotein beta subunit